ncbi:MAG: ATP-binding cassette domain-containing protein [Candidatus Omnitrophota bacterium]|nr:MAG: ATP-binding cassette domain-containing protein [Candidatus Omnitrophota bacterium]
MKDYFKEYFKLLKFVIPFKGMLFLAALCMGASTVFEGATLGMIVPVSDRILTNKKIILPGNLPQFLTSFIEKLNALEPMRLLNFMVIFMISLFLLRGIFMFLQSYLMNAVGQSVVREVRNRLYAKFQELSLEFYAKKRAGELMSRITNDVAVITNALSYALTDLMYQSMLIAFFAFIAFSLAFRISWVLPLIAFVIFPSIMIPVVRLGKRIKGFTVEIQKRMADLNSLLAETIQGAYIVKVFCRENYELKRFKDINYHYYKFTLKNVKRILAISPLTEFIGALGAILILRIVGGEVIAERVSFGIFGFFLASLLSMIRPLKKLSNVHAINQQALAASGRVYDILEEEPKVKEKAGACTIKEIKKGVQFEGIWFKYHKDEDFVLKDINLEVKKGEVIAFVGHSGAGKSTLVSLLPRLYDPQKGKILIDGIDIRECKLASLRSLISVVSQEMVLFNATVGGNIAYGREGASEPDIVEAAKKAHALEFIHNLPKALNTVVGDRGFRLSGGEKQRIAIARAILKDSPLLILDEATSQLDSASEQLIKDALYSLMEGKTVFVIAHRLSTVQKANRIVVIEKGQIVEQGTHSFLISKGSLYKKLYELQFNV